MALDTNPRHLRQVWQRAPVQGRSDQIPMGMESAQQTTRPTCQIQMSNKVDQNPCLGAIQVATTWGLAEYLPQPCIQIKHDTRWEDGYRELLFFRIANHNEQLELLRKDKHE